MPWRREWLPTSVFLPGEFHGLRNWGSQRVRHNKGLTLPLFLINKSTHWVLGFVIIKCFYRINTYLKKCYFPVNYECFCSPQIYMLQPPKMIALAGRAFRKCVKSWSFPGGSDGKESNCSEGDLGSIPGLGRSPGEGKGYPLHYSGLGNSMDRGDWRATVHRVSKSQTWLSNFHFKSWRWNPMSGIRVYERESKNP